jgi:carotenoid cleavage dioxygenase-like enzyme
MQPTVEDAGTEGSTAGDRAPWRAGFATFEREVADEPLEIEGLIPDWLSGTLVRNGPAKFEAGDRELAHWFDGYAMLHAFAIEDGDVTYANRFLDTEAYRAAEEGEIAFGEFGTDPCRSIFERFFHLFDPSLTDNACVHVGRLADEFVAMTETPIPIRFDPDTLETRGHLAWEQQVDGQLTTAHPLHDDRRGETVNYVTEIGRHSTYSVFAVPEGTTRQEPVASLEVDRPA